jgi:hypothetical protein
MMEVTSKISIIPININELIYLKEKTSDWITKQSLTPSVYRRHYRNKMTQESCKQGQ